MDLGPKATQFLLDNGAKMDKLRIPPGETNFIGPLLVTLGIVIDEIEREEGSSTTGRISVVLSAYNDLFDRVLKKRWY